MIIKIVCHIDVVDASYAYASGIQKEYTGIRNYLLQPNSGYTLISEFYIHASFVAGTTPIQEEQHILALNCHDR